MSAFRVVVPGQLKMPEIEFFPVDEVSKPRDGYITLFCFLEKNRECINLHVSLKSSVRKVLQFIRGKDLEWPYSMGPFRGSEPFALDTLISDVETSEKTMCIVRIYTEWQIFANADIIRLTHLDPKMVLPERIEAIQRKWENEERASLEKFQITRLLDTGRDDIRLSCIFPRTGAKIIVLNASHECTVGKIIEYLKRHYFGWPIAARSDHKKLLRDFNTLESILFPGEKALTLWFVEDIYDAPDEALALIKARRVWDRREPEGCVIA